MTADELALLVEDDAHLALGVAVHVYLPARGANHGLAGAVARLNEKSVVVRLESGRRVSVPRIHAIERWSASNCAVVAGGKVHRLWSGQRAGG